MTSMTFDIETVKSQIDQGSLEGLEEQLKLQLQKEPDNEEVTFLLAVCLSKKEQFAEALKLYKKTLTLDAEYYLASFNAGVMLQKLKRDAQAKFFFRYTAAIKPDIPTLSEKLSALSGVAEFPTFLPGPESLSQTTLDESVEESREALMKTPKRTIKKKLIYHAKKVKTWIHLFIITFSLYMGILAASDGSFDDFYFFFPASAAFQYFVWFLIKKLFSPKKFQEFEIKSIKQYTMDRKVGFFKHQWNSLVHGLAGAQRKATATMLSARIQPLGSDNERAIRVLEIICPANSNLEMGDIIKIPGTWKSDAVIKPKYLMNQSAGDVKIVNR